MNELIHAALPFALRPAGGKACAFSVDEAGTLSLSLSGQARSDVLIDPSGERPEAVPTRRAGARRAYPTRQARTRAKHQDLRGAGDHLSDQIRRA